MFTKALVLFAVVFMASADRAEQLDTKNALQNMYEQLGSLVKSRMNHADCAGEKWCITTGAMMLRSADRIFARIARAHSNDKCYEISIALERQYDLEKTVAGSKYEVVFRPIEERLLRDLLRLQKKIC